ncbi:MAG: zinc transport system rane protein TroC [Planctomycetota bacterium]
MTFGANTILVLAGCTLFGAIAGVVGTFVLARRRALVSDVAGHAALLGIALGFLAGEALGIGGRSPLVLLIGAAMAAFLAAVLVPPLARLRRVGDDGAIATLLAGFFGLGAVFFSLVQSHASGSQGGLSKLFFGSAAAMTRADLVMLAILSIGVLGALLVCARGFATVAFDEDFARVSGVPVRALDTALTALLVATVVSGLQIAGVVLVVALLLTPAATARLVPCSIRGTAILAAILGGTAAFGGVLASLAVDSIPTGSAMTLVSATMFAAALTFTTLRSRARHATSSTINSGDLRT